MRRLGLALLLSGLATTGAIANVRVDNIIFSIGRNFDIKYYSQYAFRNSGGTWLARPSSDSDNVVFEGTGYNIFLYECVIEIAQQIQGEDSGFDMNYALRKLNGNPDSPDPEERVGLYGKYRGEYPNQSKRPVTTWSSGPRFKR